MTETITAEQLISYLPERVAQMLGLLHGADEDLAERTLGTLPLGSRSALVGYGIIKRPKGSSSYELLSFGREVMAECANHPEVQRVKDEIEAARRRRQVSE